MSVKRQKWAVGSVFTIPLEDGDKCVGQVVGRERSVLNAVSIAIFDIKGRWSQELSVPSLEEGLIFSVIMSTKDLLDSGRWHVLADRPLADAEKPFESLRGSGFIGAKVRGSALVEDFVNAFYGLAYWDDWYLPDYLDAYLLSLDKKPVDRLKYCGRHGAV
ncbi:hypothetical protein ABB28_11640 [Stenotrophomonas chelatiphaga]|uniref:Uncharacterized protein n=1 Tax=Stenotrophomonas chelatiphaga TaxID=517011 RepID=A0A0R0D7U3_9GAMM|nr:Imm26 family immunity protein [Stenotrophomonas chelatiphaga]KRG73288.1 hypothetical protein ABB28_11640 [Stenotrophomonas chelatiphaga]